MIINFLIIIQEKIEKKISGLIDRKDVEKIYHIIEAKLTEEEDG